MKGTSQFGKALRENNEHPYNEDFGFDYYYRLVNPYINTPNSIMDKVNKDYDTQKSNYRGCIGMLLTNLLKYGAVSYLRRKDYYVKNHTQYYTYANVLPAVNLLVESGYAFSDLGSKNLKYDSGIASRLFPLDKLYQDYPKPVVTELDFSKIPLLEVDNVPIFSSSREGILSNLHHSSLHYGTFFKLASALNHNYFNRISLDFSRLNLKHDHLRQVCLTRIFKNDGCGRWYQKGGYSYQ